MRKIAKEIQARSIKEIQSDEKILRQELVKLSLDFRVNQPKDVNSVQKKKKRLAVLLTILNQKKVEEGLKKAQAVTK